MHAAHLDEHGQPCVRHPQPTGAELLALALVGARTPTFHHDLASKLQGLMMSLDEIGEISGDASAVLIRALDGAHEALREVLGLLAANRALTKPPLVTRAPLSEVLQRAADRVSVRLACDVPAATVEAAVPSLTHAFAMLLDLASGSGRVRAVRAGAVIEDRIVVVTMAVEDEAASSAVPLALAGFALAQAGGELRCAPDALVVRLPLR